MPIRPFPYPFRVGIDICHIPRIRRILAPNRDNTPHPRFSRFISRVLTTHEVQSFWSRWKNFDHIFNAESSRLDDVAKYIAGRFAAKEAAMKAVSPRRLGFRDVIIATSEDGAPYAIILDGQPSTGDDIDGQIARLSISHDAENAVAVCLYADEENLLGS